MNKIFCFLLILQLANANTFAQGLFIQSGATLTTSGNITIAVENGNITNNGNANFSNASVYLTLTAAVVTISGSGALSFNNLLVNKSAGIVRLERDIGITNNLVFQSGKINLNGNDITLGTNGTIVNETNTNRIIGNNGGEIVITVNLNAPQAANPGNLGAVISSSQNLGLVTIRRGHKTQTQNGSASIRRYYDITPTHNSALNAILRFKYFQSELNGLAEPQLVMFLSTSNGASWTNIGFNSRNNAGDYVEQTGQNILRRYTLSIPGFAFADQFSANGKNVPESINMIPGSPITIMPNPVRYNATARIISSNDSGAELDIVNVDGKKMMQKPVHLSKGFNMINLELQKLLPGGYFLVLVKQDRSAESVFFVKE